MGEEIKTCGCFHSSPLFIDCLCLVAAAIVVRMSSSMQATPPSEGRSRIASSREENCSPRIPQIVGGGGGLDISHVVFQAGQHKTLDGKRAKELLIIRSYDNQASRATSSVREEDPLSTDPVVQQLFAACSIQVYGSEIHLEKDIFNTCRLKRTSKHRDIEPQQLTVLYVTKCYTARYCRLRVWLRVWLQLFSIVLR